MKYSVKKLKEIQVRYMYNFEFVRCVSNRNLGYILLSKPFLKIPAHLPKLLTSEFVTYEYFRKIFLED